MRTFRITLCFIGLAIMAMGLQALPMSGSPPTARAARAPAAPTTGEHDCHACCRASADGQTPTCPGRPASSRDREAPCSRCQSCSSGAAFLVPPAIRVALPQAGETVPAVDRRPIEITYTPPDPPPRGDVLAG